MKSVKSEIIRFGIVGVLATAIHYLIYYLLLRPVGHNLAYTFGYGISFLANYVLSSLFTFRVDMSMRKFMGFGLSHLTNYLLQMALLNLFIWLGVNALYAPLPVFLIAVPINFLLVRYALKRLDGADNDYLMFLLIVGFAMLWLYLMDVPTLGDDMPYRFMWHTDESSTVVPISNFTELLQSQWAHYLHTNGRFIVHFLAQGFLVFVPPVVLQVLNTLLFVVLLHFIVSWVTTDKEQRLLFGVLSFFLIFVVFQGLRTSIFWSLGSLNYLWVLVAVMGLLLWMRHIDGREVKTAYYLLSPLALLVGWTHEAISLPMSVAFAIYFFVNRKQLSGRPVVFYMLWFMLGTALCLLSPGIWHRSVAGVSLSGRIVNGVMNIVFNVRIAWLLIITALILWKRKRALLKQHLREHCYGYVALVVGLAVVMLCGTTLERVAFFADFIAMLLLFSLIKDLVNPVWSRRLIIACSVLLVLSFIPACMVRHENQQNWQQAEQQMREPGRELITVRQPVKGENRLMDYFRSHYVNDSFEFGFYCVYMAFDADDINMRCAARLYGKDKLYFLPEEIVQRIDADSLAFTDYELVANKSLYVWRLDTDRPVTNVRFELNDEDVSKLLPYQRLLVYPDNSYELDDFHFEVIHIYDRPYLVFTCPTTNIYRRIKEVIPSMSPEGGETIPAVEE